MIGLARHDRSASWYGPNLPYEAKLRTISKTFVDLAYTLPKNVKLGDTYRPRYGLSVQAADHIPYIAPLVLVCHFSATAHICQYIRRALATRPFVTFLPASRHNSSRNLPTTKSQSWPSTPSSG